MILTIWVRRRRSTVYGVGNFSSIAACPESRAAACSEAGWPAQTACERASACLEPVWLGHEAGFRHRVNPAVRHPKRTGVDPARAHPVIRSRERQPGGSRQRVFYRMVAISAREISSVRDLDLIGPVRAAPLGHAPGCVGVARTPHVPGVCPPGAKHDAHAAVSVDRPVRQGALGAASMSHMARTLSAIHCSICRMACTRTDSTESS